ncbi:MAG: YhfC family intramembrane metalloprotease, partial [Candidatus Pacearchaeota archaeon]|nr:YhfC family intramembrane metalloprotease [Candidatus Pacearchaeota archaeon]
PLFFIKKYKHKFKNINDKIGFGLGFGSTEAMFIGILTLVSFIVVNIFSSSISSEAIQSFLGSNSELLIRGIFGSIERLSATMIHTFCIFALFLFVSSKKLKHLLIPIFLKTLTDGLSLYFVVSETPKVIFESVYLGIGLLAIFIMFRIMKSEKMELRPQKNFGTKSTKNNKILKALTTRLFVALIVLAVVGWIILFGKNLPSSFTPVVYAIVALTIIGSIYFFWKKPHLLQNKKIVIGLVIFIIIGAIGWITSISEITGCRPYKCSDDFICAKPTELGLKITTGECTSEFSESINFSCVKENNICIKKDILQ